MTLRNVRLTVCLHNALRFGENIFHLSWTFGQLPLIVERIEHGMTRLPNGGSREGTWNVFRFVEEIAIDVHCRRIELIGRRIHRGTNGVTELRSKE